MIVKLLKFIFVFNAVAAIFSYQHYFFNSGMRYRSTVVLRSIFGSKVLKRYMTKSISIDIDSRFTQVPSLFTPDLIKSDENSSDLSSIIEECPLTRWNTNIQSIEIAQKEAKNVVEQSVSFPYEICADDKINDMGTEFFVKNKDEILHQLRLNGCVWLRGFKSLMNVSGYRKMWESLGLIPCLDPLHSSGLRKFANAHDALYEEVNKPALRRHYIGLHQESTEKRSAAFAAFVCFQKATESGGRFTVADGAKILSSMKKETLERLYRNGIRISVSNLDTPFKDRQGLNGFFRRAFEFLVNSFIVPKFDMDLDLVWEADKKPGRLQAVEKLASPINRHPVTGVPVWFCNAHNHLRYLRDRRACCVPEVGMTDVFLGPNMEKIAEEDCEEIRRVCEENIFPVPMEHGDVLLIDNYRTLHGRETFEGDRFHAVTWFTWPNAEWRDDTCQDQSKNILNKLVNRYMDMLPKEF
jgi:hypothetical protein